MLISNRKKFNPNLKFFFKSVKNVLQCIMHRCYNICNYNLCPKHEIFEKEYPVTYFYNILKF